MDDKVEIEIITAPVADDDDALESGLVRLTEAIALHNEEAVAHGFLGGEFGYGADYENDTFMMHHFCWCDRDDCPWCGGCTCHSSSQTYVDGKAVTDDELMTWNRQLLGAMPHDVAKHGTPEYDAYDAAWEKRVAERDRRTTVIYSAVHHTCATHAMMMDRTEGTDAGFPQTAPNFWHKRSGLRVWWYKWIGRDMQTFISDRASVEAVMAECIASLATP